MIVATTLLAMAPSGEVLFLRDPDGAIWLIQSEAAGGPHVVSEHDVASAVAKHGFQPVDRDFDTMAELESYRQDVAGRLVAPAFDIDALALADIADLIEEAQRWIVAGDAADVRRLALRLLRVPAVAHDQAIHDALVDLVEKVSEPRVTEGGAQRPRQVSARQRYLARVA